MTEPIGGKFDTPASFNAKLDQTILDELHLLYDRENKKEVDELMLILKTYLGYPSV